MNEANRPTRLLQLVVEVPDPDATASFLAEGLTLGAIARGPAVDIITDPPPGRSHPARVLTLVPGEAVRLADVVFEAPSALDKTAVTERLERQGLRPSPVTADDVAGDGLAVVVGGLKLSLRDPWPGSHAKGPAQDQAQHLPPSSIRPRRLGHTNVLTPEPAAVVDALVTGFGLRLSEQIGDSMFFLRVASEHHNIGVRPGAGGGAHHIALEVHGWESYRVLCDRLAAFGWPVEYGPGRHGPGRNLFVYVRDPSSGLRFELFSDMAHIEDEDTYVPPVWRPEDRTKTVNLWGPQPPESFLSS